MKSFRKPLLLAATAALLLLGVFAVRARAELNQWVQNLEAKSAAEAAFFRAMWMPGGDVFGLRPPKETRPELAKLIAAAPSDSDLLALRAMEDERDLDFAAAEADWKQSASQAKDRAAGQIALADSYHRRLRGADEVQALLAAAALPSPGSERLTAPADQRAWHTFQRVFPVIHDQALPPATSVAAYRAWMARYPSEAYVYTTFFQYLLEQKSFPDAEKLIAEYQKAFPADDVFPVKARALLEYKRGSVAQGLAVYEQAYQPLWPPELVGNYFDLLKETHSLRTFLDRARAAQAADPDDLKAATRLFYYYQQQGNLPAAGRALSDFRSKKEARKANWTADQLYTLARLSEGIHDYNEAARYYYALYSLPGADPASQEKALGGLASLLLTAPEQNLRLGAGDLSMYQDIATLDRGPGFLNGILSLILNSTEPAYKFADEERASTPYFHRAKASELLTLFDQRFPNSAARPALRTQLLDAYANYGESDGVIRGGRDFLAAFPNVPQRTHVALLMADAFARKNQVADEFAIYDSLLKELAEKSGGVPLGSAGIDEYQAAPSEQAAPEGEASGDETSQGEEGGEQEGEGQEGQPAAPTRRQPPRQAFAVGAAPTSAKVGPRSEDYARVLDRYIARLVALQRLPDALALYRREIDRNPNDPGLYERLADFLQQNKMDDQVEQVYRRALQQFPERTWYQKLARWYLREKRESDYEALTRQVTGIFSGSELADYFQNSCCGSAELSLQLNLYAHQRFPHNLVFVRNLLGLYQTPPTRDDAAWEQLIRQYWFCDDDLRSQYFAWLSWKGRLESELAAVRQNDAARASNWDGMVQQSPAAAQFLAQGEAWRSHPEAAAPVMGALALAYPTDLGLARGASTLYRSLAYFDPASTARAVAIEEKISQYQPGDRDTLARLGDIYADREMFREAMPYWDRMATTAPGDSAGYLQAATVYWDYYMFDDALRLMEQGRSKLKNTALYSYEEGAVYEGKRDYPRAVQEYTQGALAGETGTSQSRLLELARRPATRDLVDQATAQAVSGANPSLDALDLRIAVLQAQNRPKDLEALLASMVPNATSFDLLEHIESIAQQQGFDAVQQASLERRASLTNDPVDRLRLRFALARYYEGKKDMPAAQRNIESIYHDNPAILGVVRATVDFYWRTQQQDRALAVLLEAANRSYPALKKQFQFEAARKATDAGKYDQARQLLTALLADSPYDAETLAAMADTYARANDPAGLRDFYLAKIQAFRQAPLAKDEQTARIATLRRGLILALTQLKQPDAAVDQYIEIINKYPDDDALTTEAALYALKYSLKDKLLAFYTKTMADSPKDYRWPMVLARLQAQFEDYPAAIDAYAKSSAIRPDRVDLRAARAALEERLLRFDDAAADYQKIYDLAYHDPQWMEKLAAVRARQGRTDDVVAALRKALVEGRPERPQNYFEVARRLEGWNMLPQAREFAEHGLEVAHDDLLADSRYASGVQLYARIMTRLRQQEPAYARLLQAREAALHPSGSIFSTVTQGSFTEGHEKTGGASADQQAVKKALDTRRQENALAGLQAALREMGADVNKYFTPEEKASFAAFLDKQKAAATPDDLRDLLVPLAQSAVLADQEARWRDELLLTYAGQPESGAQYMRLVELQKRRTQFDELGVQMEVYYPRQPLKQRSTSPLQEAADCYRASGAVDSEMRVLTQLYSLRALGSPYLERYFELLLARDPARLAQIAGGRWPELRDPAAQYVIAHGDARLAQAAVSARSKSQKPVWAKAYSALAGLYFSDTDAQVDVAFNSALGPMVIGDQLGKQVDRDQQLAGDIWFYYGSRYGEYEGISKKGDPEDFLASELEHTPGRASAYEALAEYYDEKGSYDAALADYQHALELHPDAGVVHDRMAMVLWKQGKRDDATAQWKEALAAFDRQQNSGRAPAEFWSQVQRVMVRIGTRKLLPTLRPDADRLLRDYIKRNGTYQVEPLLRGAMSAAGDPAAGVAWILDLGHVAPNEMEFLTNIVTARWIPAAQREPILQRILQLAQDAVGPARGEAHDAAVGQLQQWQFKWINYLLDTRQTDRAQAALDALPADTRKSDPGTYNVLAMLIAARAGRLDALLDRFRNTPDAMPSSQDLTTAARALATDKDQADADKLLEIIYTSAIEAHDLTPANFLGLAEIKLNRGDVPGAVALLRRMVLVTGASFEGMPQAATLLAGKGHPAEAAGFLADYVQATPWDAAARVQLAEMRIQANQQVEDSQKALAAAAAAGDQPYATRISAALGCARAKCPAGNPGSGELALLARGTPVTPAEARSPFFFQAREEAAEAPALNKDKDTRIKLLREALALRPTGDEARPLLLHTAVEAGRYALAVGVAQPVMSGAAFQAYRETAPAYQAPEEEEAQPEESSDQSAEADTSADTGSATEAPEAEAIPQPQEYLSGRERFLVGGQFSPAQQTALAADLARAYDKLNQLASAQAQYRSAIRLQKDPAARAALQKSLASVQARLAREKRNQERAPVIHDALEQDRVVRPRLVAQARPAPPPTRKKQSAPARSGGAL